jgi:hypothetical protein
MPNLCNNAFWVVSSFWAEAKGLQKLCELQESLFVCLLVCFPSCFFSLPEYARWKSDFMIIMGWF